ncbi:MAG: glycosyltransferase family 39 protein [Bacteroidota bacterium]|jgi:4-amino-4-deoxy-L-arabinose transferase-like glycosyltransferase|nr:glycosyltransferase family 39 protein [Bacteroidota bacterium]
MPQLTYIDTGSKRRSRTPDSAASRDGSSTEPRGTRSRRLARFWRGAARGMLRHRVLLLAALALYRFAALGMGEMQQWDEAIYALRTQAVLQFGAVWDQSAFMLGGTYYSAHPPLYVWISTASVLLVGDHLWAYRLGSAIAGALLVPLIYQLGRLLQPSLRALTAAALFAVLPLPALFSHFGQLDLLLTLCMIAALYFALRALRGVRAMDTLRAGVALAAALMTKLLFAFAIPAAVGASALLLTGSRRRRAVTVAATMVLLSLPLWLPWALSFALTHGGGVGFLFSPSLPLGATFSGHEGTPKDTGALYYLNQLLVNLSVLAPCASYSLWRTLRRGARDGWIVSAMTILLTLVALLVLRSSFEVYLIPILPLLVLHGVHGVALLRRAARGTLLAHAFAAALVLPWSLFPAWRTASKDLFRTFGGAVLPDGGIVAVLLLAVTVGATVTGVWLLDRKNLLRGVFSLPLTGTMLILLTAATLFRLWVLAPSDLDDGARHAADAVRGSNAVRIYLVGNGANPQLTFYLAGADIGWSTPERLRFERLEPRTLGVDGIRGHLAARGRHDPVAVLIERDEIAMGAIAATRDVLPDGFMVKRELRRYLIAGNAGLVLGEGNEGNEGNKGNEGNEE